MTSMFGKEKRALKLTGGDTAMQEVPRLVVGLATPDHELVSSRVTSSWSRVNPATAKVIRRRSGAF